MIPTMEARFETISDRHPTRRETFVPLQTTDLVEFLAQHPALQGSQAARFRQLANLVRALLHHLYRQRHEQLMYLYAPLDPDRDCLLMSVPLDEERDRRSEQLFERLHDALLRANYHRLGREDIERAMSAASRWGVRMQVNFDALERIDVYARGNTLGIREARLWRNGFRPVPVEVPLYQRVTVLFRVRGSDGRRDRRHHDPRLDHHRLYLRMFKNIPQQDVDMVLPATRLKMTWWDHSRIVLPSLYAIVTSLGKLLRYVVLLTLLGIFKTLALLLLVLLAMLLGVKSLFTYTINTRRRYHLNVAQNLYYQSLDNNSGALLKLLEEGEQQEACEAILAWFATAILLAEEQPVSLQRIDQVCEELVQEATGVQVDFDIEDAARDLVQMGLLTAQGDLWRAAPLDVALQKLDETWDNWFTSQPPREPSPARSRSSSGTSSDAVGPESPRPLAS
jgi:hypothetical protein